MPFARCAIILAGVVGAFVVAIAVAAVESTVVVVAAVVVDTAATLDVVSRCFLCFAATAMEGADGHSPWLLLLLLLLLLLWLCIRISNQ